MRDARTGGSSVTLDRTTGVSLTAAVSWRLRWACGLGLVVLTAASDALAQTSAPLSAEVMGQIQTLVAEKEARTPAQRKLDSSLVLALKRRRGDPLFARLPRLSTPLPLRAGDQTLVDLTGSVSPELEAAIRALGGQVVSSHPRWSELRAWMPPSRLEQLAARDDVLRIRPADRPVTSVTTQGDAAHHADVVRSLFPYDGTGVRVCVLSDGVGTLSQVQALGELPEVQIVGNRTGEEGTEGTAMLEIIHDIAPGAALSFATAFGGIGAFADNILALRASGCTIIVDDVIYGSESPFQDGPVALAVNSVVRNGALYFASAGNGGGRARNGTVWEGDFNGVPRTLPDGRQIQALDFGGTTENVMLTDPNVILLTWSESFGAAQSDYDLFMIEPNGSNVVSASTSFQTSSGGRFAFEAIDSDESFDAGRRLVVALTSGEPRVVRVDTLNRGLLSVSTTGHIFGHAAADGADAVGAAAAGPDPLNMPFPVGLERFSSDGPRRIFFTPGGVPLTPGNLLSSGGIVRMKPDFTAADRVSTATPDRRFTIFAGTSAAAPHAAAIAALLKQAVPDLPNDKLRFALKATARDIGAPGFDIDSGAGIIDAVDALILADARVPCFDGLDNDGDGNADFPADPGCVSLGGLSESPACSDGIDNDGDGQVDADDTACAAPFGGTECGAGGAQSLAVLPLLAFLARRRRERPSTGG